MKQLVQFWLDTQCKIISGSRKGIALIGPPGKGPYKSAAVWPDGTATEARLLSIANTVLTRKECVTKPRTRTVKSTGEPLDHIACPLFVEGELQGVVCIETASLPEKQQLKIVQQLQDGAVWLEAMMRHQEMCGESRLLTVVELISLCLEHQHFKQAVTEVVSDLATRYSCEQVSAGFMDGRNVKLIAISNSAHVNHRTPLVAHITDALQEAVDQGEVIQYPPAGDDSLQITRAHAGLANEHGCGTLYTIPFAVNGEVVGGFLFEQHQEQPFEQKNVDYCRQVVLLIGPVLEMRRKADRMLVKKAADSTKKMLGRVFGPGSLTWKFLLIAGIAAAFFLSLFSTEYHVVADATVEPLMKRVIVASQAGFIAQSNVRAGDVVEKGDVLASLEDKDLHLEKQKHISELEELGKEYDDALARHDRARTAIIKAKIAQVEAKTNLVDEQLARTLLTAPFAGLIVRGDLNRSLGSPVERGQVLFEVAPGDSYHLILKIDERDIREIELGKTGKLLLSGMVDEPLHFMVKKITPVSIAKDGRNYFNVEADLMESPSILRPGMEGVAKITIAQRKLFWIWTHRMVDWLRVRMWSLLP